MTAGIFSYSDAINCRDEIGVILLIQISGYLMRQHMSAGIPATIGENKTAATSIIRTRYEKTPFLLKFIKF